MRGISVVSAESNTHVSTCDGPREAPKQTHSHRIGNMACTHSFREIQRSQTLERNGRETKDEMRNERVIDSEDADECVCVCLCVALSLTDAELASSDKNVCGSSFLTW